MASILGALVLLAFWASGGIPYLWYNRDDMDAINPNIQNQLAIGFFFACWFGPITWIFIGLHYLSSRK